MRTIIHDLDEKELQEIHFKKNDQIISSLNCKNSCIGCFSCWIKHPMECAIKDEYSKIVESIKYSDELIIISKNRYGCYSNNTKRVLERCIGYVLPYFTIREGKTHHKSRYNTPVPLIVYFYGDFDKEDKKCLKELVKANAINLSSPKYTINFLDNIAEVDKCIQ